MSLVENVKASVGEGNGLTEQSPAAQLVLQSGEVKDFLWYDLWYFHPWRLQYVFYL